jgi:hypothetical protein
MQIDEEKIKNESQTYWEVDKITVDGGIKQWLKGASFAKKGQCPPEVMFAINQVKRIIVESSKFPLLFLHSKQKLLDSFNDISTKIIGNYIHYGFIDGKRHYDFLTEISQEINEIIYIFMINIGFSVNSARSFSDIISNLVEYDDAYRFRLLDMFSCTYKEEMYFYPRRTIKYIIKKVIQRDNPGVSIKFKRISWLLRIALLIPKINKSFKIAIKDSNFKKLQIDDVDFYWMCMREDYKYKGFTNDQRKEIMKARGWVVPQAKIVNIKNK